MKLLKELLGEAAPISDMEQKGYDDGFNSKGVNDKHRNDKDYVKGFKVGVADAGRKPHQRGLRKKLVTSFKDTKKKWAFESNDEPSKLELENRLTKMVNDMEHLFDEFLSAGNTNEEANAFDRDFQKFHDKAEYALRHGQLEIAEEMLDRMEDVMDDMEKFL